MDRSHGTLDAPPERHINSSRLNAKRHPITGPMLHNATRSPLARLPEDILLRIMEHADDVSILCLRRTCRTMLWLLSSGGDKTPSKQFDRLFDGAFNQGPPRGRKYITKPEKVPEAAKDRLRLLLQRDMYCESCRNPDLKKAEKKLQLKKLYCSGCKRRHPAGHFSQSQRSNKTRVCIGREGYVRVCQHHTVSWAEIEAFMASSTRRVDSLFCNDPSHNSIFAAQPCSQEHDPRVSVKLDKDSRPVPLPRCCCVGSRARAMQRRKGTQAWLHITWSTHISFPRVGKNDMLDHDQILAKVEWARNTAGGSYIFQDPPAGGSKFPTEMQLFDPNLLPYIDLPPPPPLLEPAVGSTSWKWPCQKTHRRICKLAETNPYREAASVQQESFGSKVQDCQRNRGNHAAESLTIEDCHNLASRSKCLIFHYRKSIPLNGPFEHLASCKDFAPRKGGARRGDSKRKRLVRKMATGTQTQPSSAAWFMSLDPDSISLREDAESRGVYWCDTRSCLNYHENHRHNRERRALDADEVGTSSRDVARSGKGGSGVGQWKRLRALFGMKK